MGCAYIGLSAVSVDIFSGFLGGNESPSDGVNETRLFFPLYIGVIQELKYCQQTVLTMPFACSTISTALAIAHTSSREGPVRVPIQEQQSSIPALPPAMLS